MSSPERDLLTGLQALLSGATTVPGTVAGLPYDVDEVWAIAYTPAGTDPLARWAQGVLILQTRGLPGVPLAADDIAAPLVAVLIRSAGLVLGTVTVNDCLHRGASRGMDSSKRSIRADRFDIDLDYST